MKKVISVIFVVAMLASMFSGVCITAAAADATEFVPVVEIIGVPDTTTVGFPLTLTGTVTPMNATNQDIVWSLKDAGTTGATVTTDGVLNATAAGTVVVTAEIAGGESGAGISTILAGFNNTIILKNHGSLWVWGVSDVGQLGLGRTGTFNTPQQVGVGDEWSAVSNLDWHTVAIKKDGSLWAWGRNDSGQLGIGVNGGNQLAPVRVGTDIDWASVSVGTYHSTAIKTDGSLWTWGRNGDGRLGNGTPASRNVPTRIGLDSDWAVTSAGETYTIALKNDGSLWAWGANSYGQLGNGTTTNQLSPVRIGSDNNWIVIAASARHSAAIKADGSLWTWGSNSDGQLGDGANTARNAPVRVGTDNDWVSVAAGYYHTAAVKADGSLWAWGLNSSGQLGLVGDQYVARCNTPIRVGTANDWLCVYSKGSEVFSGYNTVATKTDGSIWVWGQYFGGIPAERQLPAEVTSYAQDFTITVQEPYTVTFEDWDGTVLDTQLMAPGSAATAPVDPKRGGYKFIGWDEDFSNITDDLTVTAQYEMLFIDEDGYIIIWNAFDLDAVRYKPAEKYRMYSDVDLTGYISKTCTADKGWYPIGYGSPYFTGVLDGNGYTVTGLWSGKGWGISYKGLFSVLMGATVKNLNIVLDDRGITGGYEVGAITGDARNGTIIDNCSVTGGQIIVTGGGYAGGLVGRVYGKPEVVISDCTVTGTYTKTSGNYSGGLVGCVLDKGKILRCKTIDITSEGTSYIGGLVGAIHGGATLESVYASGVVTAKTSYAGGLVGAAYEAASISGGYADVEVSASYYGGGLVGTLYGGSTIFRSCAYGNVTTKNYIAGGLVGEAVASTISNCYAHGDVKGTTGVGGLVGYFSGSGSSKNKSVENSYSSGKVTGTGTTEYGAFNGRSGVEYRGTNYYDAERASVARAYGTSGAPIGLAVAYPQGKTTADMMKQSTFEGWDFINVWSMGDNETYPFFYAFWNAPKIDFSVTGQLKVNRKITISGVSGNGSQQDYEQMIANGIVSIEIVPLSGGVPPDTVRVNTDTEHADYKELIFKQVGDYMITITLDKGANSATVSKVITIDADLPPVADFSVDDFIYRDGEGNGLAKIIIKDISASIDDDGLEPRQWTVVHDADNDGSFSGTPIIIMGNDGAFEIGVEEVGRYQIKLVVTETYDDTIPDLLDASDRLSGECVKVIEVGNQAPSVYGNFSKQPQLDIAVSFGDVEPDRIDEFRDALVSVQAMLEVRGVAVRLSGAEEQTFGLTDALDECDLGAVGGSPVLIHVSDGAIPEFGEEGVIGQAMADILSKEIYYIGVGGDESFDQFDYISGNTGGVILNGDDISVFAQELIDELYDYAITKANENPDLFMVGDRIIYEYEYSDPENDPMASVEFAYIPERTGSDAVGGEEGIGSGEGIGDEGEGGDGIGDEGDGSYDDSGAYGIAKESFDKPGKYSVYIRVSDSPSSNAILSEAYRQYTEANLGEILVVERPIATLDVEVMDEDVIINADGYSPGREDEPNAGIEAVEWKWKALGDANWTLEPPETLPDDDEYLIFYRVRDIDGVWSLPAVVYVRAIISAEIIEPEMYPLEEESDDDDEIGTAEEDYDGIIPGDEDGIVSGDEDVIIPDDEDVIIPGDEDVIIPGDEDVIIPGDEDGFEDDS